MEKIFKALGQETRLKIVYLLKEQELCVCELESILGLSQPAISQHLRILKEAKLVTEKRMGQWVFYSLNPKVIEGKLASFLQGVEPHANFPPILNKEAKKLRQLLRHPLVEHPLAFSRVKTNKKTS